MVRTKADSVPGTYRKGNVLQSKPDEYVISLLVECGTGIANVSYLITVANCSFANIIATPTFSLIS